MAGMLWCLLPSLQALKLLLVAYLAAYLAERIPTQVGALSLIYPTLLVSGIAILLLVFQRDLGTASIFIAIYTIMMYLATGRRRVLLYSILFLVLVTIAGYFIIDIIHARIDSWLNPWIDPSGDSYQIIQSLLAIANGGVEGRGPGLGSPALVPVAISDFIYAAIAEETGLIGTVALVALFGLMLGRGIRIAMRAPDLFRRLFAAGIAAYVGVQTLLIIGGNLRLLPLTGVTLPFLSYGGSSLLTSFVALLFMMLISNHMDEEPYASPEPQAISRPEHVPFCWVVYLGARQRMVVNGARTRPVDPHRQPAADHRRPLRAARHAARPE